MCIHKRHTLHDHIKKACTRFVFCLCTSVQKGRIGRKTSKSSNIVLPFFVKDVWLSLHNRFVNTGSVVLPTSLVTFPTWLCNAWCRDDEHLWLIYSTYTLSFFFYDIISLHKILIPQLGSCRARWSALKLQFGPSTHYMEKDPGMFSSKTLISFRLKKERHEHHWHGGE